MFSSRHERPGGIDALLREGEHLLLRAPAISIKTFSYDAYLTGDRLFFVECGSDRPPVTAKEIPRDNILAACLEAAAVEPVLVLSVKTSRETRTMKLRFAGLGRDRTPDAEEWVRQLSRPAEENRPKPVPLLEREEPASPAPAPAPVPSSPPPAAPSPAPIPEPEPAPARKAEATGKLEVPADRYEPRVSYCHQCGKKLPEVANFCPFCGMRLHSEDDMREPEPGKTPAQGSGTQIFRKLLRR